jgi:hypothetical protein
MDGTVDVHGLKFHWRLERDDARTCTLKIAFGDLAPVHAGADCSLRGCRLVFRGI